MPLQVITQTPSAIAPLSPHKLLPLNPPTTLTTPSSSIGSLSSPTASTPKGAILDSLPLPPPAASVSPPPPVLPRAYAVCDHELFACVTRGDLYSLQAYLGHEEGEIHEIRNDEGFTLVLEACHRKQEHILLYLLDRGFDGDATDNVGHRSVKSLGLSL